MESVAVMLSGGVGSAVATYRQAQVSSLHLLHVDYGRTSAKEERQAAEDLADAMGLRLTVLSLPHVREIAKAQTRKMTNPPDELAGELGGPGEIPGLSATLLAVGAEFAAAVGARTLVSGQTWAAPESASETLARERTIDPRECHHAFASLLSVALPAVRAVHLDAPLIGLLPSEVVKLGQRFEVPFELTWSCQRTAPPCGTCPGCRTRAAAFMEASLVDPLLHAAGT